MNQDYIRFVILSVELIRNAKLSFTVTANMLILVINKYPIQLWLDLWFKCLMLIIFTTFCLHNNYSLNISLRHHLKTQLHVFCMVCCILFKMEASILCPFFIIHTYCLYCFRGSQLITSIIISLNIGESKELSPRFTSCLSLIIHYCSIFRV